MGRNDFARAGSYHPIMPRKATPARLIGPDWYLAEWMTAKGVTTQAQLGRLTGWGKARCNEVFHGKTEYYRAIVNEVARALRIHPWELLMHPAEANAIKAMRDSALQIAADERSTFTPAPEQTDRLLPRRTG